MEAARAMEVEQRPFFDNLDPEIAKAVDAAIGILGRLTESSQEIELPSTTIPMDQIYSNLRAVEAYAYHAKWLAESPEKYQPSTRQRLLQNFAEVKTEAYAPSLHQVQLLRREIRKTFETVDLLITPTLSLLLVKISNGIKPVEPHHLICSECLQSPFLAASQRPACRSVRKSSVRRLRKQECWPWRALTRAKRSGTCEDTRCDKVAIALDAFHLLNLRGDVGSCQGRSRRDVHLDP